MLEKQRTGQAGWGVLITFLAVVIFGLVCYVLYTGPWELIGIIFDLFFIFCLVVTCLIPLAVVALLIVWVYRKLSGQPMFFHDVQWKNERFAIAMAGVLIICVIVALVGSLLWGIMSKWF